MKPGDEIDGFVFSKDIARFEQIAVRTAQWRLNQIRKRLGKNRNQKVTYQEYADYIGIAVEKVARAFGK